MHYFAAYNIISCLLTCFDLSFTLSTESLNIFQSESYFIFLDYLSEKFLSKHNLIKNYSQEFQKLERVKHQT